MMASLPLENILCIDIETVPVFADFNEATEELKNLWLRKASNLRRAEDEVDSTLYDRAGIYAEFGKIICITTGFLTVKDGARQFRLKSFCGDNESEILIEFANLLQRLKSSMVLCAHNGKEFDFPYISRRMIINSIPLPSMLDNQGKKPWEIQHLDTMEMWKFGDYKSYTPLNLLAYVLGIASPKDDIDGSQVADVYYNANDLPRIVKYCQKDVVTVMQILLRMQNEEILSAAEIEITE